MTKVTHMGLLDVAQTTQEEILLDILDTAPEIEEGIVTYATGGIQIPRLSERGNSKDITEDTRKLRGYIQTVRGRQAIPFLKYVWGIEPEGGLMLRKAEIVYEGLLIVDPYAGAYKESILRAELILAQQEGKIPAHVEVNLRGFQDTDRKNKEARLRFFTKLWDEGYKITGADIPLSVFKFEGSSSTLERLVINPEERSIFVEGINSREISERNARWFAKIREKHPRARQHQY